MPLKTLITPASFPWAEEEEDDDDRADHGRRHSQRVQRWLHQA
jgi:hypothetical protein